MHRREPQGAPDLNGRLAVTLEGIFAVRFLLADDLAEPLRIFFAELARVGVAAAFAFDLFLEGAALLLLALDQTGTIAKFFLPFAKARRLCPGRGRAEERDHHRKRNDNAHDCLRYRPAPAGTGNAGTLSRLRRNFAQALET